MLDAEVAAIWREMSPNDILAFYQHQTNRSGTPWIEKKKAQFEAALGLKSGSAKVATGKKIARDVALFFVCKTTQSKTSIG